VAPAGPRATALDGALLARHANTHLKDAPSTMNFSERVKGDFDYRDWQRGAAYYLAGAVSLYEPEHEGIDAEVAGSGPEPYFVRLEWSRAARGKLLVWCDCPRFADTGCCKHLAATVMAVDPIVGDDVPGKGPLRLQILELEGGADIYSSSDPEDDVEDPDDGDEDSDAWEDNYDHRGGGRSAWLPAAPAPRRGKQTSNLGWKKRLDELPRAMPDSRQLTSGAGAPWSKPRQIWYLLHLGRTISQGRPTLALFQRTLKKDGAYGKLKPAQLTKDEAENLSEEVDRRLVALLAGNERDSEYSYGYSSYYKLSAFSIAPAMFDFLLPLLCASGRFGWVIDDDWQADPVVKTLAWDDGPPWTAKLRIARNNDQQAWELTANLVRGEQVEDLGRPRTILKNGLAIFGDHIARFDPADSFRWIVMLRKGPLVVPVKQEQDFVESLAKLPALPEIELPEELRWEEVQLEPLPRLVVARAKQAWLTDLECRLSFQYGDKTVAFGDGEAAWYDRMARTLVRRNQAAEIAARDRLLAAGAKAARYTNYEVEPQFRVSPGKLPHLAAQLAGAGWTVAADGRRIRLAGAVSINVSSGVDWFDLEGTCDFGGVTASLPELLAALRRGEEYVTLDDGSRGLLPREWLARYAPLAELGQAADDRLRFRPSQAAMLDALLAAQDHASVQVDKAFTRLRDQLRSFDGIRPRKEPRSFVGELRPYQREGLGWLEFLDKFAFGGCLADDMGLGKTIQVLAWLETRRTSRGKNSAKGPALVVAPRSLVFNWVEEARRFTPKLRVLNYTGLERAAQLEKLSEFDLLVTTYGTLRQDIVKLRDVEFDYAILDEAQAIKNAASQSSKACRLLNARRRLAMTGTPVENHLGELWALFEFLNPGMLGRNAKLHDLFSTRRRSSLPNDAADNEREQGESVALLAKALRPFMLRRTKQQVLTELPPKTEQTLYCELDQPERKRYDELREHYRRLLLERVEKVGINKSKVHVLEALLRLRQAACHPGLLDKQRAKVSSAKLETLLEQLNEVLAEGHKALVFSQFTSLLAIVRHHLDERRIVYEYLDGRTLKRGAKVERFQNDPNCPLFLISLKAGGQGLNLTAADYIFILDPWWNPAVEAQAVDRAHRIGQERHVFAYRVIARDTIEEKILKLQEHKRGLADAIISAEHTLLQSLTAEDLQVLLS